MTNVTKFLHLCLWIRLRLLYVCDFTGTPSSATVSGGSGEEEGSARLVSAQHVRTPQRPQVLLCRGLIFRSSPFKSL